MSRRRIGRRERGGWILTAYSVSQLTAKGTFEPHEDRMYVTPAGVPKPRGAGVELKERKR
jgi:hypothetical protein